MNVQRDPTDDDYVRIHRLLLPAEVHQATGMVSVQLGVPVDEALSHLYRYAATHAMGLPGVAARVLSHTLRFDS